MSFVQQVEYTSEFLYGACLQLYELFRLCFDLWQKMNSMAHSCIMGCVNVEVARWAIIFIRTLTVSYGGRGIWRKEVVQEFRWKAASQGADFSWGTMWCDTDQPAAFARWLVFRRCCQKGNCVEATVNFVETTFQCFPEGQTTSQNWPFPWGRWPHLIHDSLGPPESAPQTASRSIKPFL